MANGRRQFDVPHSLAANLAASNFDSTAFAHDALVFNLLVPATSAFPVLNWAKDALAEQTVTLRLERAIVDCLRLFDFTMRPAHDVFTARDSDPYLVEPAD